MRAPATTEFLDVSGRAMNTVLPNDVGSSAKLHDVIQGEPDDYPGPEAKRMMAAIGIEKGNPFDPDPRMKKILTDATAWMRAPCSISATSSFRPPWR